MRLKVWTSSLGILKQSELLTFIIPNSSTRSFSKILVFSTPDRNDLVVGWGNKPSSSSARKFSEAHKLSYVRLEDGFIGYAGHTSYDTKRLSLICDYSGIYYDATRPSDIEHLCQSVPDWYDESYKERATGLISQIKAYDITKYNHPRLALPDNLVEIDIDSPPIILLVDQVLGDMSVTYAKASQQSFTEMLESALAFHPSALILLKTHPDVIQGKKQGYFSQSQLKHKRIQILAEDYSISALMEKITHVFCVSSQLGFEALLYGKEVHCFGLPFYAGWGLTKDRISLKRRTTHLTIAQLVAAALIKYPTYRNPETKLTCEVEEIVDYLATKQQRQDNVRVDVCYALGFSLWKKSFVKCFVGEMAQRVEFVSSIQKLKMKLKKTDLNCSVLAWGDQQPEIEQFLESQNIPLWRMEDGFIRSVGLGADLRRPSCLVIDRQGLYYNSARPSDITQLCFDFVPSQASRARGEEICKMLNQLQLTKYNVGGSLEAQDDCFKKIRAVAGQQEIIIVPGQYERDQSILLSKGRVKTNMALLIETRKRYPDGFIVFKEHPDLYSGVRRGVLGEASALKHADMYLTHVDIHDLIQASDRVSTITSLTGFEALIRGKRVTVWGSPFYAGWGLTEDTIDIDRQGKKLQLEDMVYIAYVLYCRCFSWKSKTMISPELLMQELVDERNATDTSLNSTWLVRQMRKVRYLVESLFY